MNTTPVAQQEGRRYQPTTPATSTDGLPLVLTVNKCAELSASSNRHILNLIRRGEVKAVRVGHAWRVPRDAFLAYLGLQ